MRNQHQNKVNVLTYQQLNQGFSSTDDDNKLPAAVFVFRARESWSLRTVIGLKFSVASGARFVFCLG